MTDYQPTAASTRSTPWYERLLFGLGSFGLAVHWFERLDRLRGGASDGWALAWNYLALCALPFAVIWFGWRALRPAPRGDVRAPPVR